MSNRVYGNNTGAGPSHASSSVHEFICLFTHDLKRKTKRWQDGKLRYHAFNGRVMVYDDRGGMVGDSHVAGKPETLDEGEEMVLDRGGAIVQVCDRIGETRVDLEPLLDKRAREVEKRRKEAAEKQKKQQPRAPAPAGASSPAPQRALNSLVNAGTPGAPRIGRAVIPTESPYEQRRKAQQQAQSDAQPPPAKRPKVESPPSKMTHARSLFGTQLNLSAPASSWQSTSYRNSGQASRERTNVRVAAPTRPPETDTLDKPSDTNKKADRTSHYFRDDEEEDEDPEPRAKLVGKQRLGGLRVSRISHDDEDGETRTGPKQPSPPAETLSTSTDKGFANRSAPLADRLQSIKRSVIAAVELDEPSERAFKVQRQSLDKQPTNKISATKPSVSSGISTAAAALHDQDPSSEPEPEEARNSPIREVSASKATKKASTSPKTQAPRSEAHDDDRGNPEPKGQRKSSKKPSTKEPAPPKKPAPETIVLDDDDEASSEDGSRAPVQKKQKPSVGKTSRAPKKASRPSATKERNRHGTAERHESTGDEPAKRVTPAKDIGPPAEDERPRAELRIRSRKRRGLLMLAEKTKPSPEIPALPEDGPNPNPPPEKAPEKSPEMSPNPFNSSPPAQTQEETFEEWYAKSIAAEAEKASQEQGDAFPLPDEGFGSRKDAVPDDARLPTPRPPSPAPDDTEDVADLGPKPVTNQPSAKRHSSPDDYNPSEGDSDNSDIRPAKKRDRQAKSASARPTKPTKPPRSTIPDCAKGDSDSEEDWMGPAPAVPAKRTTRQAKNTSRRSTAMSDDEEDSDLDDEDDDRPKKTAAKKPAKKPKGPRLTRVNKSSNSKEIFGFQFPGAAPVNMNFGFGVRPAFAVPITPADAALPPTVAPEAPTLPETSVGGKGAQGDEVDLQDDGKSDALQKPEADDDEPNECQEDHTNNASDDDKDSAAVSPAAVSPAASPPAASPPAAAPPTAAPPTSAPPTSAPPTAAPPTAAPPTAAPPTAAPPTAAPSPIMNNSSNPDPPTVKVSVVTAAETVSKAQQESQQERASETSGDGISTSATTATDTATVTAVKTARLANPATRGKKAASKADAAGKAPEVMVPFDPVLLKRAHVVPAAVSGPPPKRRPALAPVKMPETNMNGNSSIGAISDRKDSAPQEPKPTGFPGFSRANGGAWSRHATDLLGMTRPVK